MVANTVFSIWENTFILLVLLWWTQRFRTPLRAASLHNTPHPTLHSTPHPTLPAPLAHVSAARRCCLDTRRSQGSTYGVTELAWAVGPVILAGCPATSMGPSCPRTPHMGSPGQCEACITIHFFPGPVLSLTHRDPFQVKHLGSWTLWTSGKSHLWQR